jgi:hypothetical protein
VGLFPSLITLNIKILSSTVAVALWAMEEACSIGPHLKLVIDEKFDGGVNAVYEPAPSWGEVYDKFG